VAAIGPIRARLSRNLETVVGVLVNRANVLRQLNRDREAIDSYTQALSLLRFRRGNRWRIKRVELLCNLGSLCGDRGELSNAIEKVGAAVALAKTLDLKDSRAARIHSWALVHRAQAAMAVEDHVGALGSIDAALDGYRGERTEDEAEPNSSIIEAEIVKANILRQHGEPQVALELVTGVISRLRSWTDAGRVDFEITLATARLGKSLIDLDLDRDEDAERESTLVLSSLERRRVGREFASGDGNVFSDLDGWLALARYNRAEARIKLGRFEEASLDAANADEILQELLLQRYDEVRVLSGRKQVRQALLLINHEPEKAVELARRGVDDLVGRPGPATEAEFNEARRLSIEILRGVESSPAGEILRALSNRLKQFADEMPSLS